MAELFVFTVLLALLAACVWAADRLPIFDDLDDDLDATPRRARRRPPQPPQHAPRPRPAPARR